MVLVVLLAGRDGCLGLAGRDGCLGLAGGGVVRMEDGVLLEDGILLLLLAVGLAPLDFFAFAAS